MSSRALALSLAAVALGLLAGLALLVTGDEAGPPADAAVVTHAAPRPAGPPPDVAAPPQPDEPAATASPDLLGAPPAPDAPEPLVAADERLASLSGRVVDDQGRGLADVSLSWQPGAILELGPPLALTAAAASPPDPPSPGSVSTDAQGHFSWSGLEPGPGLLLAFGNGLQLGQDVELAPGERRQVTLVLAPASLEVSLSGRTASEGGVEVRVTGGSGLLESSRLALRRSDRDGRARFARLSPGTYQVSADGHVPAEVTLAAGEEARVALASVLTQGVTGLVLGAEGEVLVTARRTVARKAWFVNPVLGEAAVDAQGRFTLWLEHPGDYTVVAERSGGGASPEAHVVVRPGQLSETTLELARGAVGGRLTWDHDGRPAAGRSISLFPDGRDRRIQVRTDADGRWVVPSLGPGTHVVRVSGWQHPADRALDHVRQTELATVTLGPGEQRLDLDGELCRGAGLTVSVTLPSGAASGEQLALPDGARLQVALIPADGRQGPARFARPDEAAVFGELAAGAYELNLRDKATDTLLRRLSLVLAEHERRELGLSLGVGELTDLAAALGRQDGGPWSLGEQEGQDELADSQGDAELLLGPVDATVIGIPPPDDG